MRKASTALCLLVAIAIAGCGGDGDTGSATEAANPQTTTAEAPAKDKTAAKDKADTAPKAPKETGQAQKLKDAGAAKTPPGAPPARPEEFKAPPGGDDSVQTYGSVAEGSEQEEVIAAMRSFFAALATLDYPAICAGLTETNRESLASFSPKAQGSCEIALEGLLLPQGAPEARKAANGSVFEVRIDEDTAFILFTPEGGEASYFVMKSEADGWHSTSIGPGTSFTPVG